MQMRINWAHVASGDLDGDTACCLAIIVSWQRLVASGGVDGQLTVAWSVDMGEERLDGGLFVCTAQLSRCHLSRGQAFGALHVSYIWLWTLNRPRTRTCSASICDVYKVRSLCDFYDILCPDIS
jgi:hypothetical protein